VRPIVRSVRIGLLAAIETKQWMRYFNYKLHLDTTTIDIIVRIFFLGEACARSRIGQAAYGHSVLQLNNLPVMLPLVGYRGTAVVLRRLTARELLWNVHLYEETNGSRAGMIVVVQS
jgi:hypothetical protein